MQIKDKLNNMLPKSHLCLEEEEEEEDDDEEEEEEEEEDQEGS